MAGTWPRTSYSAVRRVSAAGHHTCKPENLGASAQVSLGRNVRDGHGDFLPLPMADTRVVDNAIEKRGDKGERGPHSQPKGIDKIASLPSGF